MIVVLLFFTFVGAEPEAIQWNPSGPQALNPQGRVLTQIIDALLHNPDPKVRGAAADALSTCSDPSAVTPLIQAFQDQDAEVRKRATDRFSNYPDARVVEPLVKLLKDREPSVRNAALHTIWQQDDLRVVPPLMEVLQNANEDGPNRCAAAWNLTHFRDRRALEPFLAVLKDRSAPQQVRFNVAEGLLALRDKRAVEPLMAVLVDKSEPWLARAGAARALADFDDTRATGLMLDVARADGSTLLRFWAAIGAANLTHGVLEDAHVVEPIADYYESDDGVERDAMAKRQALGLIVKNGRSEAIRVMAARLFLQVRVEPWVREEKSVEGKHPDDPEAIVIQGDEMLRAFRLPEAKVLLEKSKTLLPKLNDPMRRARLESITISDLAALADTQQRWATASQAEISVERQGISALREKALIYFKGDPYVKHDTRPSTMPSVPIGADAVVEAIKDRSCDMDDADLEYLKKMPNLRVLDLCWSSHMTGAGLQSIQDANSLRKLYLPQSIKDGDLKWLRGLTELEELAIGGPGITDEGIRQVVALRNLESLHLSGERITEKAIEHLRALKRLSRLSLTQTAITDAGLKQLAEIKSLKALNLGWTQIGDAGLEHLAGLVRLEQLSVNNTRVTDRGVKKLQQSLPNCGIVISCGLAGSESCPR